MRLSALLRDAPQLQRGRTDQIAALPLGARTHLDPWTDRLRMVTSRAVPLLSGREKMPFEISPVYLHLKYESAEGEQLAQDETAHGGAQ